MLQTYVNIISSKSWVAAQGGRSLSLWKEVPVPGMNNQSCTDTQYNKQGTCLGELRRPSLFLFTYRLNCRNKTSKYLTVEALYSDLEDLEQSKSANKEREKRERDKERERESPTLFIKSLLVALFPPSLPPPPAESIFGPQCYV